MRRVNSATNASEPGWKPHGLALHSSCWSKLQICFPGGSGGFPNLLGSVRAQLLGLNAATTTGQHLIPCFFYHFYQPRRGKSRLLSPIHTLQSPMTCSTQAQNPVMHPQKLWLYNPIRSHERIKNFKRIIIIKKNVHPEPNSLILAGILPNSHKRLARKKCDGVKVAKSHWKPIRLHESDRMKR